MMDICIISQIHLFKGPAMVSSLKHYLVWASSQPPGYYLFLHRQKFLLEILDCVGSELVQDLLNFMMVVVFSDSLLLIFPIYCHPVTQKHFVTLTLVVYKFCLVLWLLSVAGCWVRTSAYWYHLLKASSAPQLRRVLLNWTWLGHWTCAQASLVPPASVLHCQGGLSGLKAAKWGDWWEERGAELLPPTSSLWGTPRRESLSL